MDNQKSSNSFLESECNYCNKTGDNIECSTCENYLSEKGFKDTVLIPQGMSFEELIIVVSENSYSVECINCQKLSRNDAEPQQHTFSYTRTFSKPIKTANIIQMGKYACILGEFMIE